VKGEQIMWRNKSMCLLVAVGLILGNGFGLAAAEKADGPDERKTLLYIAKHISAADLASALTPVLDASDHGEAIVTPEPVTNYLLVTANRPALEKAAKVLAQLDQPRKMIAVELRIIEASRTVKPGGKGPQQPDEWGLSGSTDEVMAKVRELEKSGQVEVSDHVRLTTIENQPARIHVGQRKPVVTGVSFSPRTSRSGSSSTVASRLRQVSHENVGLMVGITARTSPDGFVVMELEVEKSRLTSPEAGTPVGQGSDGNVIRTPAVLTCMAQSTVSVSDGKTVLVGGLSTTAQSKHSQLLVLVSAKILPP
jgi:type II secretory pathway component GspD/PulD (secretin)